MLGWAAGPSSLSGWLRGPVRLGLPERWCQRQLCAGTRCSSCRGQDQAFVGQPRSSSVNLHHFHAMQLRCLPLLPSLTPLVLLGEQLAQVSSAGVLACPKPPDFWAAQHSEMAHRAVTKVTALVPRSYGGWQDDKL